jgi:tRNA G10  N-methylase Trm11
MYNTTIAQKVSRQYKQKPLTKFASINPATDLNELNLNWKERDLPESTRTKHMHRIHPYLGKFIPQLVEIFLRKYEPKLVYDPFCGSGTTLVESNTLGIESLGTDISAFNVLLTKVKTAKYDVNTFECDIYSILGRLKKFKEQFEKDLNVKKILSTNNPYLNEWFSEQARNELLCYKKMMKDYHYQDLLKIILSRSARSARLVTHFDLDFPKKPQKDPYHCYKHNRICAPVQEAYKFLTRYSIDTLHRIREFDKIRTNAHVDVFHDDSRHVELPKGIDMVFTSPPYVGLIDYHDQHKYAYQLLELKNNETREIGPAKEGQSTTAKQKYIEGINQVFLHTRDYMAPKGIMAIVVNDKYDLYHPEKIGFKSIGRVERHVNRRTGMRSGAFYESILLWQKI